MKILKKIDLRILMFIVFAMLMNSCEKDELYELESDVSTLSTTQATKTYNVTTWSGLLQVFDQIRGDQQYPNVKSKIIIKANTLYAQKAYNIPIPANTTITGEGGAYGVNGKIISTFPPRGKYLFVIYEPNVTIDGIILYGPRTSYTLREKYIQSSGICFASGADGGKVQFCELKGFPGSAICFHSKNNIVYGNNIHHNYMLAGDETMGYGVLVSGGGEATIHHNYFDNNQHAIAGGSNISNIQPSFTAYMNNVKDSNKKMRSHHFDMHGNSGLYAGDEIMIYDNVFYTEARYNGWWPSCVMIRGIPRTRAVVRYNAFINDPNINTAVRQVPENPQDYYANVTTIRMYVYHNVCNGYPGDPYTPVVWKSELGTRYNLY